MKEWSSYGIEPKVFLELNEEVNNKKKAGSLLLLF